MLLHLRARGGCQLKSLPRNGWLAAGRLRLWVKNLTGKAIDLRLSPETTVEELKLAITDKEGGWGWRDGMAGEARRHGGCSSNAADNKPCLPCRHRCLPLLLPPRAWSSVLRAATAARRCCCCF